MSKTSRKNDNNSNVNNDKNDIKLCDDMISKIVNEKGYKIIKKAADTLQGKVYLGEIIKTKQVIAIKVASLLLHKNHCARINGKEMVKVYENIESEISILMHLQKKSPPKGFIRIIDYFKDKKNYYVIMEYGGKSFYDYIYDKTKQLRHGTIDALYWKMEVKKLFKQMVYYVNWLHNNKCCHLDISLENCLIDDTNNTVNFCDFGLAKYFKKFNFKCRKYCGKPNYKSPEICRRRGAFDARKADIWSLGVVLGMMLIGSPLYKKASLSDPYFCNIYYGFLKDMTITWDSNKAMSNSAYDLLNGIFKPEKERLTMNDIMNHKYLQNVE